MNIFSKTRKVIVELGPFPLLMLVVLIALVILAILFSLELIESKSLIGFLGVIVGGGLASSTSLLIAKENRRGQLAIASLDKRLETHQEAYRLWRKIRGAVYHPESLGDVLKEANEFWESHCLYLDPDSRAAFIECIFRAHTHQDILSGGGPHDEETMESAKESWEVITKPGELLAKGVELPGLGEKELGFGDKKSA